MGVRGLTSFIQTNDDLLKRCQLRECRLVIDGDNLIYYLHWLSSIVHGGHEHIFGGTYRLFGKIVRTFFNNLLRCNVEPILVMDGGSYLSDVKQETTVERLTNQLRHCHVVSKRGMGNFSILPMLCKTVFKDIAFELKISVHQSVFEADNDILMIANHYSCPVLSNDSDFFVFDVKAGFIPLKSFNFSTVKEVPSPKGKQYFIECRRFEIDSLVRHFPGLDTSLLPLFSCLIGNDYIEPNKCAKLLHSLPNVETKLRTRKLKIGGQHEKKMIQLLDWMRHKTKSEVVSPLLSSLKAKERDSTLKLIDSVLSVYGIREDNSHLASMTGDNTFIDQMSSRLSVPVSFLQQFSRGLIDSSAMNIVTLNRLILVPQVEDFALDSCYECSRHLQCLYFKILRTKGNCAKNASILTRKDSNIYRKNIEIDNEFRLDELPLLDARDDILLKLINSCHSKFESTIMSLQIIIKDVNIRVKCEELNFLLHLLGYWLQETSKSHVYLEFVVALIASIVYTITIHSKIKGNGTDKEQYDVKQHFQKFANAFVPSNANHFESRIVHLYNELQAIVLFAIRINSVLSFPLPHIRCENIFDGILIYNLTRELCNRPNPFVYIMHKFGVNTKLSLLFKFLYDFIVGEKEIKQKKSVFNSKKKRKQRPEKNEQVLSKFSMLSMINGDDNGFVNE